MRGRHRRGGCARAVGRRTRSRFQHSRAARARQHLRLAGRRREHHRLRRERRRPRRGYGSPHDDRAGGGCHPSTAAAARPARAGADWRGRNTIERGEPSDPIAAQADPLHHQHQRESRTHRGQREAAVGWADVHRRQCCGRYRRRRRRAPRYWRTRTSSSECRSPMPENRA